VVHCYTWYTHFGGMLTKLLYHVPLVVTVHSESMERLGISDELR